MELSVDLIEITRIPYHELETVYISANLAIIPDGRHVQTKISNGNKSIKFTPHLFSFLIDPIPSNSEASLVITIFTHLTNNHKIAISYVKIPVNSIPLGKIPPISLSTTLLSSYSVSPIVTISLSMNHDNNNNSKQFKNLAYNQFNHPNEITSIDYTLCEDAPKIDFDCFGRLKPPDHYIEKCKELIENNSDLFLNFILNDSLRNFALQKAYHHYQENDYVSISNISSGGQQQSSNITKQNSIKKSMKLSMKQQQQNYCDHSPQPPNKQSPNHRRQIPTIDTSISNQQQHLTQQNNSPNSEMKNQVWNTDTSWASSMPNQKQNPQFKQNQYQQQYPYISQQQSQSGPQIYQNPSVPPISKNDSPPKSIVHLRSKPQPLAEIEKQKPIPIFKAPYRGLLQQKNGPGQDDKKPIGQSNKKSRAICVATKATPKHQSHAQPQNQDESHGYGNGHTQPIYGGPPQANFSPTDEVTRKSSPSVAYTPNGTANPAMKKVKPPQTKEQTMGSQPSRRPRQATDF